MKFPFALPLALTPALLLAGCGSADDDGATEAADAPPAASEASAAAPATITGLPAAMQGSWGLVEADCDPDEVAPKGLLRIDGDSLNFYESRGQLESATAPTPRSLRGTFAFEGEGMSWSSEMSLALEHGGNTLVREDFGEDAVPGELRYMRCQQESQNA